MGDQRSPLVRWHGRPARAGRPCHSLSLGRFPQQLEKETKIFSSPNDPPPAEGGGRAAKLRRRLVSAVAVSSLGDGLVFVAFPLLALRSTSNAVLISGIAVASRLPWLLVALPAGALVDRTDRRRLVIAVDLVRALVIGALGVAILTATLPIEALYAAAFLVGTGETVVSAALRATVPLLAEGDVVVSTNGYVNAARTTGTQFAGPAIGGVIFSAAASVPFLGDALSYVVSAVLLRTTIPDNPALLTRSTTTIWADVKEGMRWFLANRTLRVLAALVTSFAFCQAMVLAVFVLYATRNLHLHATGYGILLAVAGVGDVAASLLARRIHARLGPWVTVVVAGIFAAGGYLLLSSTSSAYVAGLALAVEAAATSLGNVATLSIRHRLIPNERFGLTNNAFRMSVTGLIPVGAIVGGALTATIGAPHAFMIAGVIQLVAVAVAAIPLRRAEL